MIPAAAALIAAVIAAAIAAQNGFARFRRRVRASLERTADIEWRHDTRTGAVVAVSNYNLETDLLSTYVYRLRHRADEAVLLGELAAALRARVPPVSPPPFPLVRDRVFPLLKRTASLLPGEGYVLENRIVRRALDDDLSIVYVIEGQHRFTFVTEGMPAVWGMDAGRLHDLARTNLRVRTRHVLEEIGGPRTEYLSLDGLDAARILVADLILPAGLEHPLLAIPHEHACLIASATQRDHLAARAQAMYAAALAPLTPRLYRLTPEGPVPYDLP